MKLIEPRRFWEYSDGMSVVTETDVMKRFSSLLEEAKRRAVVNSDGNNGPGAISSMEDSEILRRGKAEAFQKAMQEFGDDIRARAAKDGLGPEDLMKILDRKAS